MSQKLSKFLKELYFNPPIKKIVNFFKIFFKIQIYTIKNLKSSPIFLVKTQQNFSLKPPYPPYHKEYL